MSLAADYAKKAADQLAKDRAEMEKNNLKQMEELAKIQPTPTIEEVKKQLEGKNYVTPKKVESKAEAKAVEPKPVAEKAGYVTRDAQASKK